MLSFPLVLFSALFAVEAADWFNSQVPSTTEAPVDAGDDVSTPIPDQLSQVFIFACIAGHHCGPVPCDDPSDSGCIGCVPDEPPPYTDHIV
ncbi:hypothetical protein PRIPAC_82692 [Pristionchus pacificus]|uniref:Uncharacterized protein n=1 Tax=Pristionchus pacificus TaxID=54126 RepID=A0A2A6CPI9_PRIPA|nr:hypothetical protein PRIPAC_82692 [Pristionchus pacificus]|eukprot:PDM80104.1 hypothetical protein PRIPAC_32683 [Pristionchus pacificus]